MSFLYYYPTRSTFSTTSSLSYTYRWVFTDWENVPKFTEQCSPSFEADGVKWVVKLFKGRNRTPDDLSLFLKMVHSESHPLRGIRKKVRIIFTVENPNTQRDYEYYGRVKQDFGKMEHPVWYCEKHATWGEESLISLSQLRDYGTSTGAYSFCVKFDVLKTRSDPPTHLQGVNELPFMSKFFNDPSFSDVTFRVKLDDRETCYYAHKVIMASSSSWFEALFTNGMKETYSKEITLADTDPSTFRILLQYCYGIEVDISIAEKAENILIMADRFGIDRVKEEAFRCLRIQLSANSLWSTWALADKYSCKKTYLRCEDYVAANLATLIKHSSFLQAKPNILIAVLKQDVGNFTTEAELYEAVIRWAKYEEDEVDKVALSVENLAVSDEESSGDISTDSFENLTTAAMQAKPPIPDTATMNKVDHSLPENPYWSKNISPIKFEDGSIVRRHSIGMLDRRKKKQEQQNPDESDSSRSGSFTNIRELFLPFLLEQIRFPMMETGYLTSTVATDEYIMSIEGMKDLLLEAYAFHLSNTVTTSQTNSHRFRTRVQRVDD